MEDTTQKYAVYSVDGGNEKLSVVVDTTDQANAERDKLKSDASKIIIKKSEVKNFGKEGEEIIKSDTIDTWEKGDSEEKEKLSDFSKENENDNKGDGDENDENFDENDNSENNEPAPVVESAPVQASAPDFWTSYISTGDLMLGMGYGFGKEEVAISEPEKKEETTELDNDEEDVAGKTTETEAKEITAFKKTKNQLSDLLKQNKIQSYGLVYDGEKKYIKVRAEKIDDELKKIIPESSDGIEIRLVQKKVSKTEQ